MCALLCHVAHTLLHQHVVDPQAHTLSRAAQALNHITGAANVRLHHDARRGVLQMVATSAIAAGAEVVNCYGKLSNSDLLRGYGFVEAANSNEHAQVPAQFLLRATAGGLAAAAGGQLGEAVAAWAAAADAGGASSGSSDQSEAGEDGSSRSGTEDESLSDESEPDFELEDDDEACGSQAAGAAAAASGAIVPGLTAVTVPSLQAAQAAIRDWEDRWALCHTLKLLPKGGAFAVFDPSSGSSGRSAPAGQGPEPGGPIGQVRSGAVNSGAGALVPSDMAAVAALLLTPVAQCKRLHAIVARAGKATPRLQGVDRTGQGRQHHAVEAVCTLQVRCAASPT